MSTVESVDLMAVAVDNDIFIKERLDMCRQASSQLKRLRRRMDKKVKEFLKLHKKINSK